MKKTLLLGIAFGVGFVSFAQTGARKTNFVKVKNAKAIIETKAKRTDNFIAAPSVSKYAPVSSAQSMPVTEAVIGIASYQLQTNSSVYRRITNNGDGTISAIWTTGSAGSDRGTGYNYFDGTAWLFPSSPSPRIEGVKTGFPSLAVTPSGKEIIVSHTGADVNLQTRPVKGTGTWNSSTIAEPNLWMRLVNGGPGLEYLYQIGHTSGVSGTPVMGQDGALAFSRSTDGGATWDIQQQLIPGLDSNFYVGFSGDSYTMDANEDAVVIVAGGEIVDLVMAKSLDNGVTWTKTVINQFPVPMYQADMGIDVDGDGAPDTVATCDGSINVILDSNNVAHVFYGYMEIIDADLTDGGYSYFPGLSGLMYWNETMGASAPVLIADLTDDDGDGIFTTPTGGASPRPYGTYGLSLTSMPSAGINANNNIYVAYSALIENTNDGSDKGYRNVMLIGSTDGGATWSAPVNVTNDPFSEGVYPSVARRVDTDVHMIYQRDDATGHGLNVADDPQPNVTADQIYAKVPTTDLVTSVTAENPVSGFSLYPNPAAETAVVKFTTGKSGRASIRIVNVLGSEVSSTAEVVQSGSHTVAINVSNMKPGVYFVVATVNDVTSTQKLVIE